MDDDYWAAVAGMRVEIADLLERLTEAYEGGR